MVRRLSPRTAFSQHHSPRTATSPSPRSASSQQRAPRMAEQRYLARNYRPKSAPRVRFTAVPEERTYASISASPRSELDCEDDETSPQSETSLVDCGQDLSRSVGNLSASSLSRTSSVSRASLRLAAQTAEPGTPSMSRVSSLGHPGGSWYTTNRDHALALATKNQGKTWKKIISWFFSFY